MVEVQDENVGFAAIHTRVRPQVLHQCADIGSGVVAVMPLGRGDVAGFVLPIVLAVPFVLALTAEGVQAANSSVLEVERRLWLRLAATVAAFMCGWAERNPITGRIPLHIDHVDGDWRNNRPENLRLLRPNHHALPATYGVLNRGSGRPYHVVKTARP